MKLCTVPGCGRKHKGRGLCDMHIQRLRRTGTTDSAVRSLEERFWEKVDKRSPDECWEWTAATNEQGYGVIRPEGQRSGPALKAHRVSAELAGMRLEGRFVRHRCDNRRCVNPAHLEVGSHRENMRDMTTRDRQSKGSHRPIAKLTEGDVRVIRRRLARGDLHKEIAADYGVSRTAITHISVGDTWGHV